MATRDAVSMPEVNTRRLFEGEVVSNKMQKTVTVVVTRLFRHPRLGKVVKRAKKYFVHDEKGLAKPGDIVQMAETRPLSKNKHMEIIRVVRVANE